jgi:hypothetical protein
VINIATALPKALGGDISGVLGLVGGLANAIAGIGQSAAERARQEAYRKNTSALARLTGEIGTLNLSTTGKRVTGIQTALEAARDRVSVGDSGNVTQQGLNMGAFRGALKQELQKQGLNLADFESFLKENDLELKDFKSIDQIITYVNDFAANFGKSGTGFSSKLDSLQTGFGLKGVTDKGEQASSILGLAGQYSSLFAGMDVSTPEGRAAAIEKLLALFDQAATTGFSAEESGGLSGGQVMSLIELLIPLLRDAGTAVGPDGAAPGASSSVSVGDVGIGTNVPTGASAPTHGGGGDVGTVVQGNVVFVQGNLDVRAEPGESFDQFVDALVGRIDERLGTLKRLADIAAGAGT